MSIIKPQNLTENSHQTLMDFLNFGGEISKEEIIHWIALWKLREKANVYLAKHLCVFKAFDEISTRTKMPALTLLQAGEIYDSTHKFGGTIITPRHWCYPQQLKKIVDFPLALHCFGRVELLQNRIFAMVGSRSASTDALHITQTFATELSKKGVTVISGFANGIDTAACVGALQHGTIQVLGSGFECLYPKNNAELFKQVVANGGLFLSEFPTNTPAMPDHFPTRNRIITGLSCGVLIGQVNRKGGVSGTLVTLRIAISQGKEIFAYPGNILDERSKICNNLIKNGTAHFTTCVEDILEIIGDGKVRNINLQADLFSAETSQKVAKNMEKFENITKKTHESMERSQIVNSIDAIDFQDSTLELVYQSLSTTPCGVSDIIVVTGLNASEVQTALSELELMGKVLMNSVGKYSIALF